MNSKFIILFKTIVQKITKKYGKKRKSNYLINKTGTSEFLKSLSATEPI